MNALIFIKFNCSNSSYDESNEYLQDESSEEEDETIG